MTHDLIIVGGGPAGLSAAIYAARFRMKTAVLASELGGTVTKAYLIENWPGEKGLSGMELTEKLKSHAASLGADIRQEEVKEAKRTEEGFLLKTGEGDYEAKTVILATGSKRRKLGVPGEEEFDGKGVSYCAVCDAAFFKDKVVGVVGGSDSAAKEALLLSEYGKKVYMIYRRDRIRAEPINAERIEENGRIEVITNTNVLEIKGGKFVDRVLLDRPYKGERKLKLDGLFIDIGYDPQSRLAEQLGVELDKRGEIIADEGGRTSIPGVYAAGDVVNRELKQAITAAAQGAVAANSAYESVKGK